MSMRIAKEFHWEMGHRLPWHEGGCRNVHGHSYRLRVEVRGTVDSKGMVMDYFDIKAIVKPLVDMLDHCFLCDEADEPMKRFFAENTELKVRFVPFPTTAENIARYILEQIKPAFVGRSGLESLGVRIRETAQTYAELTVPL